MIIYVAYGVTAIFIVAMLAVSVRHLNYDKPKHITVLLTNGETRDYVCDSWEIYEGDLIIYYKNYMSVYASGRYAEVHER